MTRPDSASTLADLLNRPPQEVRRVLADQAPGTPVDWRYVADVALRHALTSQPRETEAALAWGDVAQFALHQLASPWEPAEAHRAERDEMRLRAELIARYGPRAGHKLLDDEGVFTWFLGQRDGDPDDLRRKAAAWREIPVEDLNEVNDLKADLAVIRRLAHLPRYRSPAIERWLVL